MKCIYCGRYVKTINPPSLNNKEWEQIKKEHKNNCEWVLTQAHQKGN